MSDHRSFHQWSAAYVLGALDTEERLSYEAHLADCESCQAEVQAFSAIPGLLNRAGTDELIEAPSRVAESIVERIQSEWSELSRSRNRWRWIAGAAAVVALVLAFATMTGPSQPGTRMVVQSGSVATGSVTLDERAWGTAITLDLQDLPPNDTYVAWAVDNSGEWQQVATWGPTPNSSAHVSGASSFDTRDLERIVVTPEDQSQPLFEARNDEA